MKNLLIFALFIIAFPLFSFGQTTKKTAIKTFPSEFFEGMKYRSVGPTRGGRVTAVEGFSSQMFSFLMGSTGGGIWKTDDAGNSWNNISDGQIQAGSIGAIAVAPSDPNIIYVGTGSACPRGNVSAGIGMYKSMDGGKKWQSIGLPDAGQIGKIVVHPQQADWVYVAVLGHIFGPNEERGVYHSKDGGKTWEKSLFVSNKTGAIDLVINPHNPREIYAAMWQAERKPYTLIDGGAEGGIWKTMDAGKTWKQLEGGLPSGLMGRIGLALAASNPNKVYAIIQTKDEKQGGVWRTDNAGNSWKRISRDHQLRQRGWYYSHIFADPKDENTLYIGNVGFFKSIDGGKNFERIRSPHSDHHALWINPHQPKIMIMGNDGGACISLNGGKTWSTQYNQPTSEFYRLTVDDQFPYRLYAGQQDNSTISVLSRPLNEQLTPFGQWEWAGGSECGDVGVNHQNHNLVWGGSYSGEITILDKATGHVRQVTAYPHYTEGTEMRDLKYRWQWNFPIVVSQYDPNVVYHASNYVHRTTNNGQDWEIISPDLTQKLDKYFDIPGGPIQHDATGVEVYSSIFALEESPHQQGELWAGSDDGLLHISRDGGQNWSNITPPNMPKEGTINKIELSTHSAAKAYIAVYNYRYDDFKPYIFRTTNYGKSWTLLTNGSNGIPEKHFVRAIAEDPDRVGLLYAGTEYGMYVSFDDGKNWQSLQLNLPHVPITDLEVRQKDLVLSTQGRAFWILDDLTPLHQLNEQTAKAEQHLFQVRNTYRTNIRGFNANIYFYIKEQPDSTTKVSLEILDKAGKRVRFFSNQANKDENEEELKVKKGFNSLRWNLRHLGPKVVKNLVTMVIRNPPSGPIVVPATYQARLKVNDWSSTVDFEVLPDPRWTAIKQEDYQAQLDLAMDVSELISESHRFVENLRSARQQANGFAALAIKTGKDSLILKKAKALDKKLTAVEDQIIQNKAEASQDNINFPRVFSNHIGRLYSVLVNAHHRPTAGVLERYEDLKKEYKGIKENYQKVMEEDLEEFKKLLKDKKVEMIILPSK